MSKCLWISSVLESAKGSVGSPELTNDHHGRPVATLSQLLSSSPSTPTLLASPSPPASCHCGTIQLVLGKVPPHAVLSWAQLECALDPRGGGEGRSRGVSIQVSPSCSQEAELSQAWEQEHTCSSAQMDWEGDCPAACHTQVNSSFGENLGSTFSAADSCDSWL